MKLQTFPVGAFKLSRSSNVNVVSPIGKALPEVKPVASVWTTEYPATSDVGIVKLYIAVHCPKSIFIELFGGQFNIAKLKAVAVSRLTTFWLFEYFEIFWFPSSFSVSKSTKNEINFWDKLLVGIVYEEKLW